MNMIPVPRSEEDIYKVYFYILRSKEKPPLTINDVRKMGDSDFNKALDIVQQTYNFTEFRTSDSNRSEDDIYIVFVHLKKFQEDLKNMEITIDRVRSMPDSNFNKMLEDAEESDVYIEEKAVSIKPLEKLDLLVFLKNIDTCELDILQSKVKTIESLVTEIDDIREILTLRIVKEKIEVEIKSRFRV